MNTELAHQIGSAARAARQRLELSQADAAERAGISAEFYARIERGGTLPSTPTLVAIADALEVSTDVLVGRLSGGRVAGSRRATERAAGRIVEDAPEIRRLLRRARKATPKGVHVLNVVAAALAARSKQR